MKLNLLLLAGFFASLVAHVFVGPDPTKPNKEFLPDMVHAVAYETFAPNPNFPDGKTLQPPVPGTVPRRRPVSREPSAERGQHIYQTYCLPCHGPEARGDGLVAQRGYPPPPSLHTPKARHELSDDQIFQIISKGQKNMPPHAAQIPPEDRRSVIVFLRALQVQAQVKQP